MKGYLRYVPHGHFGLVASPESNAVFSHDGKSVFTAVNELVAEWDLDSGERRACFSVAEFLERTTGSSLAAERTGHVTRLAGHPLDVERVVAGYFDGSIRVWQRREARVEAALQGHRSGISALTFSADGTLLASGSWDTDIVIWDLVSQAGLFRLRGHRNQVTGLAFLYPHVGGDGGGIQGEAVGPKKPASPAPPAASGKKRKSARAAGGAAAAAPAVRRMALSPAFLVSGSKDGTLRVWDLATQVCMQTVFGVSSEVWSLAVTPAQDFLVAGTVESELLFFTVDVGDASSGAGTGAAGATAAAAAAIGSGVARAAARSARFAAAAMYDDEDEERAREEQRFFAPVLAAAGGVGRGGRGRVAQLVFVPPPPDAAAAGAAAGRGSSGGGSENAAPRSGTRASLNGAAVGAGRVARGGRKIDLKSATQSADAEAAGLLVALAPAAKALEFFQFADAAKQQRRLAKRQRRALQRLRKKQTQIKAVEESLKQLEQRTDASSKAILRPALAAEREVVQARFEKLAAEITALRGEMASDCAPTLQDRCLLVHRHRSKKKPVSLNFDEQSARLLVSLADASISLLPLPVRQLLAAAGVKTSRSSEEGGEADEKEEDDVDGVGNGGEGGAVADAAVASVALSPLPGGPARGHGALPRHLAVSADDGLLLSLAGSRAFLWDADSCRLTAHVDCETAAGGSLSCGFFVAGNTHAVVGTTDGSLLLLNLATLAISQRIDGAHKGAITAVAEHPKRTGFATTGVDKQLKYFQFYIEAAGTAGGVAVDAASSAAGATDAARGADASSAAAGALAASSVAMQFVGEIQLAEEALALAFSPTAKLLAVALLDFSIQLLKPEQRFDVHLTLYGHSLAVNALAVSSDGSLLLTGSSDKTIKVWGTDFGNIHKSWVAHEGGVLRVAWLRLTHFAVSAGRDGAVKLWDLDRRQLIQQLAGSSTRPAVALAATRLDADRLFVAFADFSVRVWRRTDEQMFPSEETEARLEEQLAAELAARPPQDLSAAAAAAGAVLDRPTRRTVEAITNTEKMMEALEMVGAAIDQIASYRGALELWRENRRKAAETAGGAPGKRGDLQKLALAYPKPAPPAPNPAMLGMTPFEYFFEAVSAIPAGILHEVIVGLPFKSAEKLLTYAAAILHAAAGGGDAAGGPSPTALGLQAAENVARVALTVVQLHLDPLIASDGHSRLLAGLRDHVRPALLEEKSRMVFNVEALRHLSRQLAEQKPITV